MAKTAKAKKEVTMEEALWKSADKLRGSVEPAEYKHVVLSLFFLKFASDKFEAQRKIIIEKYGEKFVNTIAFYTKDNVFFLPEISRWSYIMENAKQSDIALKIDTALYTIAFIVISDGANNKYGSFFSPYDFFYAWRKIEADDKELDGINSLVTMVSGLFRKERILAVIKDFVYFPDSSDKDLKIVCRYPQYFAAVKLFDNIKTHLRPAGDGKGGTYFGATGCGKSYTMLFLTRMLMRSTIFHSPTILIITDRTDLDDQLSKQFISSKKYIGDETVVSIDSREKLRQELQGRTSGGVYMTTIQKFTEDLKLLTDRANLQVDLILLLDEFGYPPVTIDDVYKEVLAQAENFKKYAN